MLQIVENWIDIEDEPQIQIATIEEEMEAWEEQISSAKPKAKDVPPGINIESDYNIGSMALGCPLTTEILSLRRQRRR